MTEPLQELRMEHISKHFGAVQALGMSLFRRSRARFTLSAAKTAPANRL